MQRASVKAERQKARAEQHAASQAPGKRSNIAFASSSRDKDKGAASLVGGEWERGVKREKEGRWKPYERRERR
ncbi:hypothetical protein EXIGLDRAFT_724265 [Exidia glandulosa HHB12029]|uniref:Uncharacterized protein n=1 Tax=Exidia glandulosa HHB12029 TaxID=1314781 RepID=A0A166BBN4_EXIGL|nr:hypothetical protein EXIGLDRAFT_724265 [Exidia glandulosa HHB12029]